MKKKTFIGAVFFNTLSEVAKKKGRKKKKKVYTVKEVLSMAWQLLYGWSIKELILPRAKSVTVFDVVILAIAVVIVVKREREKYPE